LARLPPLSGEAILVRDCAQLTAHRGKLVSVCPARGTAVYAASFIRQREMVLETDLLARPRRFRLILIHELFHFVWSRLGNRRRREFEALLREEQGRRARGGLGESSDVKRERLTREDGERNSARWRDYVCESFCDTAAWFYAGQPRGPAFTLAKRWRDRRAKWIQDACESGCRC
jgi:hypothetical protein